MPSPFPGMDPYLEDPATWTDFHDRFIVYWRDALNDQLPDNYEGRVNHRTCVIDIPTRSEALQRPDVAIHRAEAPRAERFAGGGVATLEPVKVPFRQLEEVRETFIEIRRRPERTVVAVLELLSPSNKPGSDRHLYLDKRIALTHQDVHIVELDLLLGGERIPVGSPLPRGDYFLFLSHADRRLVCDVYHWSVRDPLPTLPIPLQAPDSDVFTDLAAVFATAYNRGRYGRAIDYGRPLSAPLSEDDRDWARELVAARSH